MSNIEQKFSIIKQDAVERNLDNEIKELSLIQISETTRLGMISKAVF